MITSSELDLLRLQHLIASRLGLTVPDIYRGRVEAALGQAASVLHARSAGQVVETLEALGEGAAAWQAVIAAVTVAETCFMRQREWFGEIETRILGPLLASRRREGYKHLRIWSAGCSTGEEPYSLAMLIDRLLPDRSAWTIDILGTDIDMTRLATAARGQYRQWTLRELTQTERARYFRCAGNGNYALDESIRRMVSFSRLNLAAGPQPGNEWRWGAFDLIVCRHALMYLTLDRQRQLGRRLARSLAPDGWLAVSPAEANPECFEPLVAVNSDIAIFFHRPQARDGPLPARDPDAIDAGEGSMPPWAMATGAATVELTPAPAQLTPPAQPATARPEQPPSDDPHDGALQQAWQLADRGQLDAAGAHCQLLIERDALDYDAHLLLAMVLDESGELEPALAAARRAAFLQPDSASAYFILGRVLTRLGDGSKGLRCMAAAWRSIASTDDDSPLIRYGHLTAGMLRARIRAHPGGELVPEPRDG